MKYEVNEAGPVREELWDEKTVRVHTGGFNINPNDFPRSVEYIKKGTPLAIDWATRNAKPVKTVTLAAALEADDTEVIVKKNHTFLVNEHVGNGTKAATISAIDSVDTATDKLTISAALGALPEGTVLTISTEAGDNKALLVATKLNYADVKLEGQPSVSAIYAADEVRESKLPYALTDAIKTSLTVRFLIIP
ncbi:hypothetical protein [Parapedobacter indicus]|uniref:Uncharacterized protein n=1 Tax=Parapedobacter indicus TaxID=1477437 RepID=A0A1I3E518_9SPHI|nr:hypothetical protein [Parapedobacter indicus]PPL04971.1 hypothetical protein CLV26_101782 [Parapedobacter indicus]SFH94064.1 hypothetical protein SAMN05444682_101768 [Parapedobacter indicus]